MTLSITPIYAGLAALIFIWLSARVIRYRRAHKLSLGDAGNNSLLKRMRAHANFAEYTPLCLFLLLCLELQTAQGWIIHVMGAAIVLARLSHAYGFSASPPMMQLRVFGTATTLIVLAVLSLLNIGYAVL